MAYSEVRNDTEMNTRYVRVLDPKAAEISFVRTSCEKKQALYVSCANLGSYEYLSWINAYFHDFICLFDWLSETSFRSYYRMWASINIK